MKGIDSFRIKNIYINQEYSDIEFMFRLKKVNRNDYFNHDQLTEINTMVEQMIFYLNNIHDYDKMYTSVRLKFYAGRGRSPIYILCNIAYEEDKYVFYAVYSKDSNDLSDLYMMKNVHYITLDGGNEIEFDEEKIEKLSNLKELKEICYKAKVEGDYFTLLRRKLNEILPNCKLYHGEEEIMSGTQ